MITWRDGTATSRSISAIYRPIDIPSIDVSIPLDSFLAIRDSFTAAMPGHESLVDAVFKSHYKIYELIISDFSYDLSSILDKFSPVVKYKHIPLIISDDDIQAVSGQYRVPLPSHIFSIEAIVNKPFDPTITWDDEFYIDGDYLYFLSDPRASFYGYYGGGQRYFYVLWLKNATLLNSSLLDRFFTYLIDVNNKCVDDYYDRLLFTLLMVEALAKGLTPARLRGLAALYYEIPISVAESEIVLDITPVTGGNLVKTDKMEYFVSSSFELAVSENDKLTKWTPLVEGFNVIDFHDGVVPSYVPKIPIYPDGILTLVSAERTAENASVRELEDVSQRHLEKDSIIVSGPSNTIYAVNNTVQTTIVETARGYEISWPLEGSSNDVTLFWDRVRERERTLDVMLYNLLSEYYEDLSTINPAEVMVRFFYRCATAIILPANVAPDMQFISVVEYVQDGTKPLLQVNAQ